MARFLTGLIQSLVTLIVVVVQAALRVTKWWWARTMQYQAAGKTGLALTWFVGGLCIVCTGATLVLPSSPSGNRTPRDVAVPGARPSSTVRSQSANAARVTRTPRNTAEPAAARTDAPTRTPRPSNTPVPAVDTDATSTMPAPPTDTPQLTATPEPATALVQVETLNARTGPSDQYDVLTQVAGGTELPALAFSSDRAWVQVLVGGNTPAWVMTEFVQLNHTDALGTAEAPELVASPTSPPTATRPPAPTSRPAPPPSTGGGYNGPYDPFGPDVDCGHFSTHAQAQAFFIAAGGPARDPHRLDQDNDGIACESLP